MKRTTYCGLCRETDVGSHAVLSGWVQTKRDMGGIIFLDLRDREGTMQVVCNLAYLSPKDFSLAEGLKAESVISVEGALRIRDKETYNPKLPTGTIELRAGRLELLSEAQPLPFQIEDAAGVREELRLQYRFLDLRRPEMLENLRFRHLVRRTVQDYLDKDGFLEVETPMLTKSTPEGARDYLVPSRVYPGSFYALPQSPQIFKQLLMVGGVDKYYQIARCFRDEDLRADRQPEFTQVDMELSFVDQEDILTHLEKLFRHLFREVMHMELPEPFPRMTWAEAMDVYGVDKPDLRFGLPIIELTDIAGSCGFSVFRSAVEKGGVVRGINVKGGAAFSRTTIEALTEKAGALGAKGMAWIAIKENGEVYSILSKYFTADELDALLRRMEGQPGDFLLFCADRLSTVRRVLGGLRLELGDMLGLRKKDDFRFLFVTDFPQFEWSEEEERFMATHHPFTMPYPEDLPYLCSDPGRVRAQAYDAVLNGIELGSGSIRIHRQDIQEKMFQALGFSQAQIEDRFGFLVNAFRYGTPPHGGFAFGLDRIVMLMLGADSLREVIAFPKMKDASCPLTNAPDVVDEKQLKLLGISTGGEEQREALGREKSKKPSPEIDADSVAELSKLILTPIEQEQMKTELSAIIGFADQLSLLKTDGIAPSAHILPLQNVFREDEPLPSFKRAELLANAAEVSNGCFRVQKVME